MVDAVHHLAPQRVEDEDVLLLAGRRQDLPVRVELKVEDSTGRGDGNLLSDQLTSPLSRPRVFGNGVEWVITVLKILLRSIALFPKSTFSMNSF